MCPAKKEGEEDWTHSGNKRRCDDAGRERERDLKLALNVEEESIGQESIFPEHGRGGE